MLRFRKIGNTYYEQIKVPIVEYESPIEDADKILSASIINDSLDPELLTLVFSLKSVKQSKLLLLLMMGFPKREILSLLNYSRLSSLYKLRYKLRKSLSQAVKNKEKQI